MFRLSTAPLRASWSLVAVRASSHVPQTHGKFTVPDMLARHKDKVPFTMVTAYDYPSGKLADEAGIDMILVGDSVAQVVLGLNSTVPVTMDEMIHHARAVSRGAKRPLLVGDMPFGSYESSHEKAIHNAGRFMKEAGMEAVKLEGGRNMAPVANAITRAGIPVIGHIGLTPQSASSLGGYKVQGRTAERARKLLEDALALQDAGVAAIVLEAVPDKVAQWIVSQLEIPTIGIGAGTSTSGQVLVWHDLLGVFADRPLPKFAKAYAKQHADTLAALTSFKHEVSQRSFPSPAHVYTMKEAEYKAMLGESAVKAIAPPIMNIPAQNPQLPTVAVMGSGALGTLLTGRLAGSGKCNAWVVGAWSEQIAGIANNGILIRDHASDGKVTEAKTHPAAVTISQIDHAKKQGLQADIVIVATKAAKTEAAGKVASRILKPGGILVTVQNGVGHPAVLSKLIAPSNPIIQGVMEGGASLAGDFGVVNAHGQGALSIANMTITGDNVSESADALVKLFNVSGLRAKMVGSLESVVWGKLVVSAAINPLTALTRSTNVVAARALCRETVSGLVKEVFAVAKAGGVHLPYRSVDEAVEHVLSVATATGDNTSSMLADVKRGTSTEIDWINGVIVREGERLGVPTPLNRAMHALVTAATTPATDVAKRPATSPRDRPAPPSAANRAVVAGAAEGEDESRFLAALQASATRQHDNRPIVC